MIRARTNPEQFYRRGIVSATNLLRACPLDKPSGGLALDLSAPFDVVLVCLDLISGAQVSLRDLRFVWAPFMDEHASKTCRVLLVGNKAEPQERGDRAREVNYEQAKVCSRRGGALVIWDQSRSNVSHVHAGLSVPFDEACVTVKS